LQDPAGRRLERCKKKTVFYCNDADGRMLDSGVSSLITPPPLINLIVGVRNQLETLSEK